MSITANDVSHRYGETVVLEHIDLAVAPGKILCLLGPSGSGKSTLLKLLAGLEQLQSGRIELGDHVVTPDAVSPPEARSIGLVFQQHALFPHLTVEENIAFGLADLEASARRARVSELLSQVALIGFEHRYPHSLSGGQQQRVAIARALAPRPALMLLDEPFANVDLHLSQQLREDTRRSLREQQAATVMVTHDAEEALDCADELAVLVDGRIVQTGTAETLWRRPAHRFVAETIRGMQIIDGKSTGSGIATAFGLMSAPPDLTSLDTPVSIAVDAHTLRLREDPESDIRIDDIRPFGADYQTLVRSQGMSLRIRSAKPPTFAIGTAVAVDFADSERFFYY